MGIVRQAYAAFNRGDVDAAFESLAPEFECDMSRAVGINVSLDTYDLVQSQTNRARSVSSLGLSGFERLQPPRRPDETMW